MPSGARGRQHSWLTPKATLGPSSLGGQGLIAVAPIPRHELVAIWGNRIMTTAEMWALPEALQDFPVQVWYDMFVGPMAEAEIEPVDYMNHSCEPTCGVRGSVVVVARRDLAPGDELTFDYGTTDTDRWTLECHCGAATCRGRMTGEDWRDPAFQARHAGYLSCYIENLIAHETRGAPLIGLPPGWSPPPLPVSTTVARAAHGTPRAPHATARRGGRPGRRPGSPGRPR